MIKSKSLLLLSLFTGLLLWWQAQQPMWNDHMQVDVWISWQRIEYWFTHSNSFVGLVGNEILPATLLYVFAPVWLSINSALNYSIYLPLAMIINFAVVGAHWFYIKDKTVFLTSLIFLGPILLFRFEPMVTLLLLLSFDAFAKEKFKLSGLWLGLATAMKVFPVILLPYLCLLMLKKHQVKLLLGFLIFFVEALLGSVLLFLLMGGNLHQLSLALSFHSQKLISIESIPGSLITGWSLLIKGVPPELIPGNGIWAVPGPANLFNKLWMIPVLIFYFALLKIPTLLKSFSVKIPYVLFLVFLVFSKNLNPQYVWWFMCMLPLVKPSRLVWVITLIVALLNQLVFPIYYTIFVENFYRMHLDHWIYYILLLRNVGIVTIAYLGVKDLFFDTTKKTL
jgi:hypothetical protein